MNPPVDRDLTTCPTGPPKFPLGQMVITPAAREVIPPDQVQAALTRHQQGDWGDCDPDDAVENELSLQEGFRLFSVYHTATGLTFWVITEADRSVTTILLPNDY